jgi:hypothetical protein
VVALVLLILPTFSGLFSQRQVASADAEAQANKTYEDLVKGQKGADYNPYSYAYLLGRYNFVSFGDAVAAKGAAGGGHLNGQVLINGDFGRVDDVATYGGYVSGGGYALGNGAFDYVKGNLINAKIENTAGTYPRTESDWLRTGDSSQIIDSGTFHPRTYKATAWTSTTGGTFSTDSTDSTGTYPLFGGGGNYETNANFVKWDEMIASVKTQSLEMSAKGRLATDSEVQNNKLYVMEGQSVIIPQNLLYKADGKEFTSGSSNQIREIVFLTRTVFSSANTEISFQLDEDSKKEGVMLPELSFKQIDQKQFEDMDIMGGKNSSTPIVTTFNLHIKADGTFYNPTDSKITVGVFENSWFPGASFVTNTDPEVVSPANAAINLIYNLPNAEKLTVRNGGIGNYGNILAPNAEITYKGGNVNGSALGASFTNFPGESHSYNYDERLIEADEVARISFAKTTGATGSEGALSLVSKTEFQLEKGIAAPDCPTVWQPSDPSVIVQAIKDSNNTHFIVTPTKNSVKDAGATAERPLWFRLVETGNDIDNYNSDVEIRFGVYSLEGGGKNVLVIVDTNKTVLRELPWTPLVSQEGG